MNEVEKKEFCAMLDLEVAIRALLYTNKECKGTTASRICYDRLHEVCDRLDDIRGQSFPSEGALLSLLK